MTIQDLQAERIQRKSDIIARRFADFVGEAMAAGFLGQAHKLLTSMEIELKDAIETMRLAQHDDQSCPLLVTECPRCQELYLAWYHEAEESRRDWLALVD